MTHPICWMHIAYKDFLKQLYSPSQPATVRTFETLKPMQKHNDLWLAALHVSQVQVGGSYPEKAVNVTVIVNIELQSEN